MIIILHLKTKLSSSSKGFALPLVIAFLMFFFTLASYLFLSSRNEIARTETFRASTQADYYRNSIIELVRLKLRELPVEFVDAVYEFENPDIEDKVVYNTFISDFQDPERIRELTGLEFDEHRAHLVSLRRKIIGSIEDSPDRMYVTDVFEAEIQVSYSGSEDTTTTQNFISTILFKRRYQR